MAEPKKAKNGTWEFIFDAGKKPDGRRNQIRRRGFKTKREALDALAKIQTEINEGSFVDHSKIRIHDFMEEWLRDRKRNVEPETFERDYGLFKNHICTSLSNLEIQQLTPIMMQKLLNNLNKTLSAGTVHVVHSLLKQSLQKAVTFKLIKENPMTGISSPKRKKIPLQIWDEKTIKVFIDKAKDLKIGHRYYIGYVIALLTGMRRGEILGLSWNDVDFDNGLVFVRQTLSSQKAYIKDRTKTEAGMRTISIPKFLINMLKEQKQKVDSERLMYGSEYEDNHLVVCTPKGTPICPKNFYKTFKEVCRRLELPVIRIHDLRHSHATLLIAQNVNPKIISERLGHNDIGVTLDIYSHVLPSMQKEVANTIDLVLGD